MSDGKELTLADFAAMFRLGPEKMTMTKADAVRLAELAQVASEEITRLRAALKWNIERDGDDLLICEGDHERHEDCTMQRWVRAEKVATARQEGMEKAAKIGDRHIEIGEVLSETEADKRLADNIKMQVGAMKQVVDAIRAAAKEEK